MAETLKLLCELLTADPEGGPSRINFELWKNLYQFLATIDKSITQDRIKEAVNYLGSDVLAFHWLFEG